MKLDRNKIRFLSSLFLLLIIFNSFNFAQKITKFRKLENNAFTVGEKLTFEIKYGFVTAGVAVMEIPKMKRISGRDVYQITFKVNSLPSFDPLYKVRDRYETYLDKEGIFPWRFEQHIREGGYSRDFSAFFDQRRGKAKTSEGTYKIPLYVNDIISAFYYARLLDFSKMKEGEVFELHNFYKDKVYPLQIIYHGKETINVDAGTFRCIIVEPVIAKGGLFKTEGNIIIWLSDDQLRIPVKVKTKIIIGSIDAELTNYKGLLVEPASAR
ncbi:ATP-dependent exoDNAse (exonuclease V) alpha subunit - helicase superfamily I member [hydrothermal vent metagenome]|uniref:ATP-dependent exoDNAse (Exonuclease V) alpha subunit - helicase superfamily I member n=1 Tax=hydrothermal vent metagenome TaxID=652676 RepID=A0A3B1C4Z6_9ZZZZ